MYLKKSLLIISLLLPFLIACQSPKPIQPVESFYSISLDSLKDKIKGGWAGQTIGVTYGGPTEFKFKGTMIQEYQTIPWKNGAIKWYYDNEPGLFDDVYMDLTFVDVFERCGMDAPADSFALAFANAGYVLWHANQAARYNILNGIMPPLSGHWKNNTHADCIDYQIEADFAGLMSPGMPNTASEISDKIGHIMNYGDGWYGGVYVGAMYSLAFVSDDMEYVVKEALKTIPDSSDFYKCMETVIKVWEKHPEDWRTAWFEVEKNWSSDIGCPVGVFEPYNIDAKVNCAYVIIGLLYGKNEMTQIIDISTRCGQDSDCNPATAAGIFGTMIGYNKIPDYWKNNLKEVEDMDFKYTSISLNDVYTMGFGHALKTIERNGGKVTEQDASIALQSPKPVRFEKSFPDIFPIEKKPVAFRASAKNPEFTTDFEGKGFVLTGAVSGDEQKFPNYKAEAEVFVDGAFVEKIILPLSFTSRKTEIYWNYNLKNQKHSVSLKWLNPVEGIALNLGSMIIYSVKPKS